MKNTKANSIQFPTVVRREPNSAVPAVPAVPAASKNPAVPDVPAAPAAASPVPYRSARQINEIIVHCSATKPEQGFTAADVRRWHTRERGFVDIGYHFVVETDGSVSVGRPLDRAGAHCLGHNARSVGVCYMGGIGPDGAPADTRTPPQRASLRALLADLARSFPRARIRSHRDFARKACPCFDATAEYADLCATVP